MQVAEIDRRLLTIQPPEEAGRVPRELSGASMWKSREYRNFLLYWVVAAFQDIAPNKYMVHWLLLSSVIWILDGTGFREADIQFCEECIDVWHLLLAELYGTCFAVLCILLYYDMNLRAALLNQPPSSTWSREIIR